MSWSDLCDYGDTYIVGKGAITVEEKKEITNLSIKNNTQFRSCISKVNDTFIENAGDLDNVMSNYNLLEYSDNYSMTSRSL